MPHYYTVPLVDAGYSRGGRRVRKALGLEDAPSKAILFRDFALVGTSDPLSDQRAVKLAEGKDETLALASRTELVKIVKDRELKADAKFDATIVDLLKSPPDDWGAHPLLPDTIGLRRAPGYYVWLGPEKEPFFFESVSKARHSVGFRDSFTRSNGGLNGSALEFGASTWAGGGVSSTLFQIVSNAARATGHAGDSVYFAMTSVDTDTANSYVQANVNWVAGANSSLGIRIGNAAGGVGLSGGLADFGSRIYEIYAESADVQVANASATSISNGLIALIRSGSTVELTRNGSTVLGPSTSTTENTSTGNRRHGLSTFYLSGTGPVFDWDDFEAADIGFSFSEPPEITSVVGTPGGADVITIGGTAVITGTDL